MFAALPRLGNEIAMLFQPIPSANGTDKFVEIRLSNANSKNVLVSMTNNIVIFFFFFVNSLSNHTRHHNEFMWSMNYRWGKISMLFDVQFCQSCILQHQRFTIMVKSVLIIYLRKMSIYPAIDECTAN